MRNDFAIFIMVYGRPEKMWTLNSLRRSGYTGKVFFVADNTDKTLQGYIDRYGKDLLVFDKREAAALYDSGDNSGDLRSTLYAANTIPRLARENGIKYFVIMCDDYLDFRYNFDGDNRYKPITIFNMDKVFDVLIDFWEEVKPLSIAMGQGGDFIGGADGSHSHPQLMRKSMNSFLCSIDKPINFIGRLNEDVTTYVNLGNKGDLFFTITNLRIYQKETQSERSGLTDVYIDLGTYTKSFFSVMYNPSCVQVAYMRERYGRIHHQVNWNNAVPKIIRQEWRKATE